MSDQVTLGERIRKCRNDKHMTLAEVAAYVGIAEASLQRYESGSIKNPKQMKLKKIADLFGVDWNYLLGYDLKQPKEEVEDEDLRELMVIFKKLGKKQRHILMAKAYDLEEECKE